MASFSIPHVAQAPDMNTDQNSATWLHAASAWIEKDCSQKTDYPKLKTEVRAFWTDSDLYLVFVSPYSELNLWLPADNSKDRLKLGTATWSSSFWRRLDRHQALSRIRNRTDRRLGRFGHRPDSR